MDESKVNDFDPLLEALIVIAKIYDQPISKEALLAGLPVKGKIDENNFLRAANRANFTARLNKGTIASLYHTHLPAILLLKNDAVVVLEDIHSDSAIVVDPYHPAKKINLSIHELETHYDGYFYHITPTFKFAEASEKLHKSKWLWQVLIKLMPTYSEVILASFLINIFALALPLFVMNVYNKVIPNKAFETLWTLGIIVVVVLIFDFILRQLRSYFIDLSSRNVDTWFSASLFEQLLDIKMANRPRSVGPLLNSVYSFDQVKEFLSSTTIAGIVDFPFAIIFIFLIYLLGGWLVLVPLITIPIIFILTYINQARLTSVIKKTIELNSRKQAMLIETLQNIQAIKVSLSEGLMQHRWEDIVESISKLTVKSRFYTNSSLNLSLFTNYFASVVLVVGGVYLISAGQMQIGGLIASSILLSRALAPFVQIAGLFTKYKNAKASFAMINSILELPVERTDQKSFLSLPTIQGHFEFREVSFTYPHQRGTQLENISLTIKAHEHVGILGLNGSGKSTLLKLILKLYEPTQGTLLVDGIDNQQLDPSEIRRYIGYIPQEVLLFQGTIKDNLKMGTRGIDDEQLLKTSDQSGLSRFIRAHPEGFNRLVGEGGLALSGGERQVVAFAKALLLNPSVLIMDEPTNSMDEISIFQFKNQLKNFSQGKTIILVTHKLDLLNLVDRLIILQQGKIIADGPKEIVIEKLKERAQREKPK